MSSNVQFVNDVMQETDYRLRSDLPARLLGLGIARLLVWQPLYECVKTAHSMRQLSANEALQAQVDFFEVQPEMPHSLRADHGCGL